MEELKNLRKKIDKLDFELIKILAKRIKIAEKIGYFKAKNNLPLQDLKREKLILEKRKKWASKLGLEADFMIKLFKPILAFVHSKHKKIKSSGLVQDKE